MIWAPEPFRIQILVNYITSTSTGIDADASKGETSVGYLTASCFNAMHVGY